MRYIAHCRFLSKAENMHGSFTYFAEAGSNEEAELRLYHLLRKSVRKHHFFPAPCEIFLDQIAEIPRSIPQGLIAHFRFNMASSNGDCYFNGYLPEGTVRRVFGWDRPSKKVKSHRPDPFLVINCDRSVRE